ncbi:hypothetical protein BRC90_04110 [Halobacteriales archaeon QS_4_69_34]|nr:MAG: hypothetical protein BRC90_04110 [Halobacteriales archaeon QS_4_69_34]
MGAASTPPTEQARSIFTELGYTVSGNGTELRAERKWRVVRVTAVAEPEETPDSGDLRCFVTWKRHAEALRERLLDEKPDYDWAIIGVDDTGDYEVIHPTVGPTPIP